MIRTLVIATLVDILVARPVLALERGSLLGAHEPLVDVRPQQLRIPVQVAWQITSSRLLEPGSTPVTKSFREVWTLEIRRDGSLFLKSARSFRTVFSQERDAIPFAIPRSFLIGEWDLAALVGIEIGVSGLNSDDSDGDFDQFQPPIFVNLVRPPRGGTDLSLSLSDDRHYEVHIDFGGY